MGWFPGHAVTTLNRSLNVPRGPITIEFNAGLQPGVCSDTYG